MIDPARVARAVCLEVELIGDGRFLVTGGAGPHVTDGATCDCADHQLRGNVCKHLLAVRLAVLEPDLRAAIRALVEDPCPAR